MLMYQRWLFSWLTVCHKLVCCRKKTDRNARKSGSKKSSVNATLHLIFSDRFQKLNMQNLKYRYSSLLYTAQHIDVNFFSVMRFAKSNHRTTLKNEYLGELIRTASTTYCPGFRGLEMKKILIPTITAHRLII